MTKSTRHGFAIAAVTTALVAGATMTYAADRSQPAAGDRAQPTQAVQMDLSRQETLAEVQKWFFDDYIPRWVKAGERGEDSSFITEYWGAPLWVSIDDIPPVLAKTEAEVTNILRPIHARLKVAGYHHTAVPDRKITVFNSNSAEIKVIWSRRRADDSEIERHVVNFLMMRRDDGWRILSIQQKATTSPTVDAVWPTIK